MGVGDPLEAAGRLAGPIKAGTWHLVGDGIALGTADITYQVLWRSGAGDVELTRFQHHFDEGMGDTQFDAVLFEADADGIAAAAQPGDQLVLRFSAENASTAGTAFIPNADGANANGRIPSITLPQSP